MNAAFRRCLLLLLALALLLSGCIKRAPADSDASSLLSSDDASLFPEYPPFSLPLSSESSLPDSSAEESSDTASSEPESSRTTPSAPASSSSPASSSKPTSSAPPSSKPASSAPTSSTPQTPAVSAKMKAVWVSYLEIQSFAGSAESAFTSRIHSMFQEIHTLGLNTVIVQVRPYGDSFYASAYYPWSKCISGTMGQAVGYDPLAIMVREAHSLGLQIHAWINPYRTMNDSEFSTVPDSYPTKKWYNSENRSEYMVQVASDNRWWLQPGNPEVQQLITNGAKEIVQNYQVDGLHIDDYFYGTSPSAYGDTTAQAKANTTAMVRGLYTAVKSVRSSVKFGVSPLGAFAADQSLPNSDLNYLSTNLKLWCTSPGYLDYVMPQIYWEYTHATQPFTMTLEKWSKFVTEPSVALYVGLAPYKIAASEIESQAADVLSCSRASGYCLFRYDYIHSLHLS